MFIVHDDAYYESRKPEPDLGTCKNFLRFIWNKEKRAFLDRTAKEWGQVGLFYLLFFGVLFSILSLQMWITVNYVTSLDKPYFQRENNVFERKKRHLISSYFDFGSPGISFQPNVFSPTTSPIIWVSQSHNKKARPKIYVEALDSIIKDFQRSKTNYDPFCVDGKPRMYYSQKPCFFDIRQLGQCSESPYGYTKDAPQPCVFIKFNKRFNWIPDYYNQTSQLPHEMPNSLNTLVKSSEKYYIWLSCTGANNVDKEHIGEIEYLPTSGFPVQYFPYTGNPDDLSPIVALRFLNLTINRLITVQCTTWAHNIERHRKYDLDFQIMIG